MQYVAASNLTWLRSMTGRAQLLGIGNHCRQHLESVAFHQDEYITTSQLARHEGLLGFRGSRFEGGNAWGFDSPFCIHPPKLSFLASTFEVFHILLGRLRNEILPSSSRLFLPNSRFHLSFDVWFDSCWFIPFTWTDGTFEWQHDDWSCGVRVVVVGHHGTFHFHFWMATCPIIQFSVKSFSGSNNVQTTDSQLPRIGCWMRDTRRIQNGTEGSDARRLQNGSERSDNRRLQNGSERSDTRRLQNGSERSDTRRLQNGITRCDTNQKAPKRE